MEQLLAQNRCEESNKEEGESMSLSEIIIKLIGITLAIVGFCLLLAAVNLHLFGIELDPIWVEVIVGVLFLGGGIYIVRGGNIGL